MKSLMAILDSLLLDAREYCPTEDRLRDIQYCERRVKHEGMSFLTITLPEFCDDFDQSLSLGYVTPRCFLSFRKHRSLPSFLKGLTCHVFDCKTGRILDNPAHGAIKLIRQITRLCKKIRIPCSAAREKAAFTRFIEVESEIKDLNFSTSRASALDRISWTGAGIFNSIEKSISDGTLLPAHGPGAVAVPMAQNAKYCFKTWSDRLQSLFPFDHYALPSSSAITDERFNGVSFHAPGADTPVRVIAVPKTLKTPRIIAIEPVHMQFVQQGIKDQLYSNIESDPILGGQINFSDQSINRRCAHEGSVSGDLATIDLSEASDRVSLELVRLLFAKYPLFLEAILACRSDKACVLVDGQENILDLAKFASMGSALCFPIEALCFYYISIAAIMEQRELPANSSNIRKVAKEVYVYGDDIIVPCTEVGIVMDWLESFGLKINRHKSFFRGRFRESCGADYFRGELVTPIYIREMCPHNKQDSSAVVSWVSLANQFYRNGYWNATKTVRSSVEQSVGFELPTAHRDCSGLAWETFLEDSYGGGRSRWCPVLHKTQYKTLVVKTHRRKDTLNGYPALLKFFLKKGLLPFQESDHLEFSARRGNVSINYRWMSATP